MANHFYRKDLPDGLDLGRVVAIDTETLGVVGVIEMGRYAAGMGAPTPPAH